jgi:hypothetical protein
MPVDDPAPAGGRVQPECLGRGIGVQQAPRHGGRIRGIQSGERGGDGGPQPRPQRQVARIRIDPVEPLRRCGVTARQGAVHPGQGRPDQPALGWVVAGERMARDPRQHGQPAIGESDGELPGLTSSRSC